MKTKRQPIQISLDTKTCTNCSKCSSVCPTQVFRVDDKQAAMCKPYSCIRCGHCVAVCAPHAISHSELTADLFEPVDETDVQSGTLIDLLKRRRSCRLFSSKAISETEINELMEVARLAPTSTNRQDVSVVILQEPSSISLLSKVTGNYYYRLGKWFANPLTRTVLSVTHGRGLVKKYHKRMPAITGMFDQVGRGDDRLFYGAPAVIVMYGGGPPQLAQANCNLATMALLLHAESKGLGTCYNGFAMTALSKQKKQLQLFGIPNNCTVGSVIAVGHPKIIYHRIPPRGRNRVIPH